ncbi:Hypothetical protein NGAL_HAMBI1146_00370 [Neorhizobium galegae bv. officinalis]|nr:Hypothetical protein NGAL_HAMBI1146_00370 [Neorhizobium galegae bv. officinalis]
MASADIVAPLAVQNAGSSGYSMMLVPFEIGSRAKIIKPDDLEVATVVSRDGYSLLAVVVGATAREIKFTVSNAFLVPDDRFKNRMKFEFDFSYTNFKQHATLMNRGLTYLFDLKVELPKVYGLDELSFDPGKDAWAFQEPTTYTISSSHLAGRKAFVAFPNPLADHSNMASLVVGFFTGLLSLIGSSYVANQRKLPPWALIAGALLSMIGFGTVVYFYLTLSNPVAFIAPLGAAVLPWICAPFICGYLLLRRRFDAEISGVVEYDGRPARYVKVSVCTLDERGGTKILARDVINNSIGEYRFFIWCRKPRKIFIQAEASPSPPADSNTFDLEMGNQRHIPPIHLLKVDHRVSSEGSSTGTTTR